VIASNILQVYRPTDLAFVFLRSYSFIWLQTKNNPHDDRPHFQQKIVGDDRVPAADFQNFFQVFVSSKHIVNQRFRLDKKRLWSIKDLRRGAYLSAISLWARMWIHHEVCDAWLMRCETCGYLPYSFGASPYMQITLLYMRERLARQRIGWHSNPAPLESQVRHSVPLC